MLLLQRAHGIGYGRAARLIDFMAEDGIVGQYNGSQARDVMISLEDWESRQQGGAPTSNVGAAAVEKLAIAGGGTTKPRPLVAPADRLTAATVPPSRRNKIVPEPDEPSDLEDEEDEFESDEADEELEDDEMAEADEEYEDDEEEEEDDSAEEDETDESDEELDEEESDEEEVDEDEEYDNEEWEDDDSEEEEEVEEVKTAKKPPIQTKR